jgi:hypothetical protein
MEKESQSARQQDTNKLKEKIWEFFALDDAEHLPVPRHKTGRGFNHSGTARALCPRAYIWDFDNDEGYVSFNLSYLLTLLPVFSRGSRVEKSRSRRISFQTSFMTSELPTCRYEKRIGMSRTDYYVQSCVCGYVVKYFWSRSGLIYKIYRLINASSWATDSGRLWRGRKNLRLVRLTGLLK